MTLRILAVSALLAAARPAGAAPCPTSDRAEILESAPERLLVCGRSRDPIARAWAAHASAALARWDEAARLYGGVAAVPRLASIRPLLLIAQARSEEAAGRAREGAAVLSDVTASPRWLRGELSAARADLLLVAGDPAGADAAAREALGSDHAAADALWLDVARAALARHDQAAWDEAARNLELNYPGSEATLALERVAAPFARPVWTPAEEAHRWARWIARGGASTVASECVPALAAMSGADDLLSPARLQCGRALATMRSGEARPMLRAAARSEATRSDALLELARVAARGSDPRPVADVCHELDATNDRDARAECAFLAAFVTFQSGDRDGSSAAMNAIVDNFPGHPRAAEAAWFVAFDALHSPGAPGAFDRLVSVARDPADRARALYWRGRVLAATDRSKARADWEEVLRAQPFGYYGWLAAERLSRERAGPSASACVARPGRHRWAAPPADARMATLLLDAGFAREAARALAESTRARQATALSWVDFLADAGQWTRVLDIGVAQEGVEETWPARGRQLAALRAAFPLAFPAAVTRVRKQVDACLLLALMRRESRFDSDATSSAQAVGLLQLVPRTASEIARDLGEPPPAMELLHAPAENVRLAAHYLHRLAERFRHPLLEAAAYNAGARSVATWTRERAGMPIDEWVERIPFRETRAYVKAVGGAYAAYVLLYAGHRPRIDWGPVRGAGEGVDY